MKTNLRYMCWIWIFLFFLCLAFFFVKKEAGRVHTDHEVRITNLERMLER